MVASEGSPATAASRGEQEAFARLIEPHRRLLHLHCYRMMGSLHDAEDLAQETLLRAWQGIDGFHGSSFRAWLFRIATNTCLNALGRRRRESRILVGASGGEAHADAVPHLEPYPDELLDRLPAELGVMEEKVRPDFRYETKESISIAFMVATQLLPPRQRAVLLLRDVLDFSPSEVADQMASSVAGVNSLLQRARSTLRKSGLYSGTGGPYDLVARDAAEDQIVARFVSAWEGGDIRGLVDLLTDDAVLSMPPQELRLVGPTAIGDFLSTVPADGDLERIRLVATAANRQPALAAYILDISTGAYNAYGMMVLTTERGTIRAITGFADSTLFRFFGLGQTL